MMLDGMIPTIPSSRCWATGHLVITTRKKPSPGPGNYLQIFGDYPESSSMLLALKMKKVRSNVTMKQLMHGVSSLESTLLTCSFLAGRITSGKWQRPDLAGRVVK